MIKHVGFTGTQKGLTFLQADRLHTQMLKLGEFTLHNGQCEGADHAAFLLAGQWQRKIVLHPPTIKDKIFDFAANDYRGLAPEVREDKPYLLRNQNIVDESDMLIACPQEETEVTRSGTWSTIRKARKKGIPISIIFPSGRITKE